MSEQATCKYCGVNEGDIRVQSYRAGLNDMSGGKYTDDLIAARDEARVEWEDTVDGLLRANTQLLSACEAVLKDTGSNKLHPHTRRELFAAIRETRGAL